MRLIDADVLKQHIDKLPALPDGNFAGNHSALKALINMQPTFEPSTNCSEVPNSSDAISRQAAIDALDKRFDSIPIEQTTEILLLRKDLRDLPTAEPQRIKGKWALQSDDYHEYYECDQCGIAVGLDDIRNFCPNCGAKMDAQGEE